MKGQVVAIMLVIVCGVAIHVMFGATLDALRALLVPPDAPDATAPPSE